MDKFYSPPESDEIEISLFGPGYGECITMHLGNGDWIVIDSCLEPTSKEPAALYYFQQLDVNPTKQVSMIIASHWHDDHIRGLSNLLSVCPSAEMVISHALEQDDFMNLIYSYSIRSMTESSGCNEMFKIFEIMKNRPQAINRIPKWASCDKRLKQGMYTLNSIVYNYEIWSLSPSNTAIMASIQDIAEFIPSDDEIGSKRCVASISPNRASVVVYVSWETECFLFGSDLENSGQGMGWEAIYSSNGRPTGRSCYFKIPHHGSINAHSDVVWSNMLDNNPFSTLTPFELGDVSLPTQQDIGRIKRRTTNAFTTVVTGRTRELRRHPMVQRTIKETVKYIRLVNPFFGHIRFRIKKDSQPRIDLFGTAQKL